MGQNPPSKLSMPELIPNPPLSESNPFFESDDFKDFVANRNKRQEDFPFIAALAKFSNSDLIEFLHNFFNTNHEQSGPALDREIVNARTEKAKEIYQAAKRFYDLYDWTTSYNLVRVIERRKKK